MNVRLEANATRSLDYMGASEELTRYYIVDGVSEAGDAAETALQAVYGNISHLLSGSICLKNVEVDQYRGGGVWRIAANYERDVDLAAALSGAEEEATFSFDTSGGTAHVLKGLELREQIYAKEEGHEKLYPGLYINWNGRTGPDRAIGGVDIISPNGRISFTKRMRYSRFTTAYQKLLFEMTGKVNDALFKGWEEGELLFLGANSSGKVRSSELITVSYNFSISRNETVTFGTSGVSRKKEGWDILWSLPGEEPDASSQYLKLTEKAYFITRVYERADFRKLGI